MISLDEHQHHPALCPYCKSAMAPVMTESKCQAWECSCGFRVDGNGAEVTADQVNALAGVLR